MGQMRFTISPPHRVSPEMVQQAYLVGFDHLGWQSQVDYTDGQLTFDRSISESASLHMPWDVGGHGRLVLPTGSLRERPEAYPLPLELARGTISQIHNQVAEWQTIGLQLSVEVVAAIDLAMHHFGRAAVRKGSDPTASTAEAEIALTAAVDAANRLVALYVDQAMTVRRRGGAKLEAVLGVNSGTASLDETTTFDETASPLFQQAFDAAIVPICWRAVEAHEGTSDWTACDRQFAWARNHDRKLFAGPLLQLDLHALPDWLCLWEGDFENLATFVADHVKEVVTRFRGKVDAWICAGRLNTEEVLSLSEEDELRLVAESLKLVRSLDPNTPLLLSFDRPWAEYMNRLEKDFPPLHFADALVRAGIPLSGLMLELNLGYWPDGTLPRMPLELSRLLDHWSTLGLPLYVTIIAPSAPPHDPMAGQSAYLQRGAASRQTQQAWAARYVPLILAKAFVRGVFWNQLHDGRPHDFPHGGLIDESGQAKPVLRTLASIRRTYLSE